MALTLSDLSRFANLLEGYKVADQDVGATSYYGYINKEGEWYIIKETVAGSVTSYRYIRGASGYATNWTNRATLSYDYFDATFKGV